MRVFTDPRCLLHTAPAGYPERPERLASILERLRASGLPVEEPQAELAEIARATALRVHDLEYVERFERSAARGDGLIDSADNPLTPATPRAAWGAAEAAVAAADWVWQGEGRQGFVAVRPPGHHAERAMAMGFCYLNNAAIAAERLRRLGARRVAIFDFDVHHGNGTQHIFEERGDVFYLSTHQHPFYPGTGLAAETGRGEGAGATLNVPLPAGTGDEGFAEAFAGSILPAIAAFAPDALVLSAGFDAWQGDPLGGMRVSAEGYAAWGRSLGELAACHCGGRVLALLEGGYDLAALPDLVATHLEGLVEGARAGV